MPGCARMNRGCTYLDESTFLGSISNCQNIDLLPNLVTGSLSGQHQ